MSASPTPSAGGDQVEPPATLPRNGDPREEGSRFMPKFGKDGTLPVVTSCARTGQVLMLAYMNAEALQKTIETGEAHYFSRSKGRLWKKGEESGNIQRVVELRTDCDQDALWMIVEMIGDAEAACHTGRRSCFYRAVLPGAGSPEDASLRFVDDERIFDPRAVYGHDDAVTEP